MKLIRQPMLHFAAAGAVLFALHGSIDRDEPARNDAVRLTVDETAWLVATWSRRWRRQPDEHELRGLVADYIREQLLAREARALSLDENDPVITSRLAQKMEFLIQDTASAGEPSDAELRQLYSSSAYRAPARAAFTQIFFKSEAAARAAVDDLATADLREIGDPTLLARDYAPTDVGVIESAFGPEFIGTLAALEPGAWHGPIASPYGFHLVYLHQRHEGEILPFEQVRPRLVEEWRRIEQQRANELLFTRLLEKYRVVVDDSARALLDPQLAALTASTE